MEDTQLTLSICLRCRDGRETDGTDLTQRGGRHLARAVVDLFASSPAARSGVRLRGVHCMSQCKRPCVVALSGTDRFAYVFGDLDPGLHAAAVLDAAATYAIAEQGFLTRAQRPEALQGGILGRLPPLGFDGDLVEPLCPPLSHVPMEISSK